MVASTFWLIPALSLAHTATVCIALNLLCSATAPLLFPRTVLPRLLGTGGGTMIFTGATAAIKGGPRFASLASAKFAFRGLAQSLAREFGPQGVHVVHPVLDGLIWCPQTRERFKVERDRCIEPDAVARTYLQLVGQDRSAWTNEIDVRPFLENF